jgi:hypothetical protein
MRELLIGTLLCSVFASAPVLAEEQSQPVATQVATTTSDSEDTIVCKAAVHEGVYVGKVCESKREWERSLHRQQRELQEDFDKELLINH